MGGRVAMIQQEALIGFLEALYRWDTSEEDWLRGLCGPVLDVVPAGLWVQANTYDASGSRFNCPTVVTHRAPPMLKAQFLAESARWSRDLIVRCYYGTAVATLPSGPDAVKRETGAAAVLSVKGLDPSGRSAALNIGLAEPVPMSGPTVAFLRKVSDHIATAARVRHRLAASSPGPASATEGADAVFSADRSGRLLHAEPAAKGRRERARLVDALRARETAREGKPRHQTFDSWRPLVDARWTLVDSYESNGERYIVARENQAEARSLRELSERERQVVVCLAFGQTTKEAAYSLGIDASTVRVLLQRAEKKLAVSGRTALLDHPAVKALRGGIDAAELERLRGSAT
jgi:DNA-binding CsgD family transcriptional regulator